MGIWISYQKRLLHGFRGWVGENSWLSPRSVQTPTGDVKVYWVYFNADKLAAKTKRGNTCRARPHERIKNCLPRGAVEVDKVFGEFDRLLIWVNAVARRH